ncbi:MAG: hypothetical protein ACX98W_01950 [bacterium]
MQIRLAITSLMIVLTALVGSQESLCQVVCGDVSPSTALSRSSMSMAPTPAESVSILVAVDGARPTSGPGREAGDRSEGASAAQPCHGKLADAPMPPSHSRSGAGGGRSGGRHDECPGCAELQPLAVPDASGIDPRPPTLLALRSASRTLRPGAPARGLLRGAVPEARRLPPPDILLLKSTLLV